MILFHLTYHHPMLPSPFPGKGRCTSQRRGSTLCNTIRVWIAKKGNLMRYQVGILLSETSSRDGNRAGLAKEIKRVVRASSINDAIASLMKAEDLPGAYAAYAYPIRSGRNAPILDDWR